MEKQVELIFENGSISVGKGTKHRLYREGDNIFIEQNGGVRRKLGKNRMVSGKKSNRGPHGSPYVIEVQDDLKVRIKVFNSANPVNVPGLSPTTHSPEGIAVDQYDSRNKVSIGGTGGPSDFSFFVKLPEDPSEVHTGDSDSEDRSLDFRSNRERQEGERVVKTETLRDVTKTLDNLHRKRDIPTIRDFFNELGEENLLKNAGSKIIYIDNGKKYTVKDIHESVKILLDEGDSHVPAGQAHKVSTLPLWRSGLQMRVTSEGNLRSDIGELFVWNESNNVLIGERANQPRIERIDEIIR